MILHVRLFAFIPNFDAPVFDRPSSNQSMPQESLTEEALVIDFIAIFLSKSWALNLSKSWLLNDLKRNFAKCFFSDDVFKSFHLSNDPGLINFPFSLFHKQRNKISPAFLFNFAKMKLVRQIIHLSEKCQENEFSVT